MEKYGVIDLGTNTFHLLVATPLSNKTFKTIFKKRIFVKLAEDGIQNIGFTAYQRALNAMIEFKDLLDQHNVVNVRAIGTAALRTAKNGSQFVQDIKNRTNISIELISGEAEAFWIYKGVQLAIPPLQNKSVIMDIGGGSVEFILVEGEHLIWSKSFPIGVAVLKKDFQKTDPLSSHDIQELSNFLNAQLLELKELLSDHLSTTLIGASGTFDVLENYLGNEEPGQLYAHFPATQFQEIYDLILPMTQEEILKEKNIPPARAEMIAVAMVLIKSVLSLSTFQEIMVSPYALKEGILSSLMDDSH